MIVIMQPQDRHIIFMGTPGFAVESLKRLVQKGYIIDAVVTAPDKPSGRGLEMHHSPVKQFALEQGLMLLQPERMKDPLFLDQLAAIGTSLQVVVAFRMLPREVWSMSALGTINLHASLLPQYRGAAPINWALINGETVTGVTTFFIEESMDTGNIILQREVAIEPGDNAGLLHDRLMKTGAELVIESVESIFSGTVKTIRQNELAGAEQLLKNAPKLTKELCRINWNDQPVVIYNHIRGLSPYPAAWTMLDNGYETPITFKIFSAMPVAGQHQFVPGTIITEGRRRMLVAAANGFVELLEIQQAGKKRISASDFLNGFTFNAVARFV